MTPRWSWTTSRPTITVVKTNNANGVAPYNDSESMPEPGGTVPFKVTITNNSTFDSVAITSLADAVGATPKTMTGLACTRSDSSAIANPQSFTLAPSETVTCTYTRSLTGNAGGSETDTFTATGHDTDTGGATVSDDDTSTVTFTNVAPTIAVVKTNDANGDGTYSDSEGKVVPGGVVPFKFTITNNSVSSDTVTITSLVDKVGATTVTMSSLVCKRADNTTVTVPFMIPSGQTVTCTFTKSVTGIAGYAETDTVTASGTDDDGSAVTGSDTSTVTLLAATGQIAPTATTCRGTSGTARRATSRTSSTGSSRTR